MGLQMADEYPSVADLIQSTHCSFCLSSFSNSSARRLHEIKKHNSIKSESDKKLKEPKFACEASPSSVSTRFFCPFQDCAKFYSTKKLLTQHYMKSHNPKNEKCDQCGLKFALKRDRIYHQKKRCPNRIFYKAEESLKNSSSAETAENTDNTETATLIRTGSATVILLKAQSAESLLEGIVAELRRKEYEKVDENIQTDDLPNSARGPLLIDSMSQSIQTVQYPPFLETRHVETSTIDNLDDFSLRHIETQTLPMWSPSSMDYNRYFNV